MGAYAHMLADTVTDVFRSFLENGKNALHRQRFFSFLSQQSSITVVFCTLFERACTLRLEARSIQESLCEQGFEWERQFEKVLSEHEWGKSFNLGMLFASKERKDSAHGRDQFWPIQFGPIHFWPFWSWPGHCGLFGRPVSCQAHFRSHSGHNVGVALSHAPTVPEFTIPPHPFHVLLLERLRLPLLLTEATCEACHEPLDPLGRHRAACPNTGRLKKRASPVERVLVRICREAGACVKFNARLRDMNVGVASTERNIEVLAQDLPWRCAAGHRRDFTEQPNAADVDGAVLLQARTDKEMRYPELMTGRCRLVVVAIETGGRWSDEAVALLWR